MARHVARGELRAYLWGQHYKGVPEVYLASAVFAAAGPSVIALKSVTLACFAIVGCLQFVLVRTLFSPRIAWVATAFLAFGPPSLVLWSLSGNAEIVMTLGAGALMGLGLMWWHRTGSPVALATAAAAVGFGLWVQQYILYYIAALGIVIARIVAGRWRELRPMIRRGPPAWWRVAAVAVLAIAVVYLVLGAVAFLTGGFTVAIGRIVVGLSSPQKLWRIAAILVTGSAAMALAGRLAHADGRPWRVPASAAAAGFLLGYWPAVAATFQPGRSTPVPRMDVHDLRMVSSAIAVDVLPIVAGFRSPTTEWLPISPWFAVLLACIAALSYWTLWVHGGNPFFHTLLVVVPVLFIASGSFVDAQSYRYLMPVFGALPVVLALGVQQISRWSAAAASVVLAVLLGIFAAEQLSWYRRLAPDTRAEAAVACLRASRLRGGFADYWLSYKVTFLTDEQIIVAPITADRYPPYADFVRSLGLSPVDQPCRSVLLQ